MMRLFLLLFLIPLFLILVSAVCAIYFGWQGVAVFIALLAALSLAVVLTLRLFFRRAVRSFERMLEAKAAVLRGAEIEIHGADHAEVTPSAKGHGEGEAACWIDVSIAPVPGDTPFRWWEPDSLSLLETTSSSRKTGGETDGVREQVLARVEEWLVMRDGKFVRDPELGKLDGTHRLRLRLNFERKPAGPVVFEYGSVRIGTEFMLPESVFDMAVQARNSGIQVAEFYLLQSGVQVGPLTLDEIQRKFDLGEITGEDMVWHDNLGDWAPLSRILTQDSGA